jgi:hypothetical protein
MDRRDDSAGFERHGHRSTLDDDLPPTDDGLVRNQEEAAAAEARRIGGTPHPSKADPAHRPLEEAGEGEGEGFELAERELYEERAVHGDERSNPAVDSYEVDAESEHAPSVYGEADEVDSTEVVSDPTEGDDPGEGRGRRAAPR